VLLLKHWLFGDYGPLDRLLEMTVVALILYEIIAEVIRRRAEARHKLFIHEQTLALMQRLTKGERLHGGVPNTTNSNQQVADRDNGVWIEQVREWVAGTNSVLSAHSPKASSEFMSLADAGHVNLYVGNAPHGFYLRGESAGWYKALAIHLENLRRIVGTPEAYY
jgi:hypothetical protein